MHPPVEKSPAFTAISGIRHGFFGRRGGVSEGEFESLNVSRSVGDDLANVTENVHRAVMGLKAGPLPIALVKQVHGADVLTVTAEMDLTQRPEADAMVTSAPGIALGILTADCAPVLLADETAGVIGAAHAGWRSAVNGILANTVEAMTALGAAPERIEVAIGPTISADNYEVGDDFAAMIRDQFPNAADHLVTNGKARPHFDVAGFLVAQTQSLGLKSVSTVGSCTYANPDLYFSHRYATHNDARAGRQIALVARG
ncbi:peptidoglycan editing factor PgeF [Pelagibacterium xiamenense]|uniref:peptidoglycan editing factor PgeF n=1 Tax=Pelagibacterium xiamenense TaxID=2901140 RepID=UPI001E5FDC76|nr:peptidoglycan editing factor PgeF [Pelagibacterium xiamenense]MCD7060300.1 peptidoglycan editing factor PgeF [Pelagibacterium xiamenense]